MKKYDNAIINTLNETGIKITTTTPPNSELGDISIPCFPLAKELKKSPMEISKIIEENLKNTDFISKIEFNSGYLNVFLKRETIINEIISEILNNTSYGSSNTGKGLDLLIEHTSINPNASPHIGRARNAIIGDAIVRLLKFEGYNVKVHYFINDIGKQIAMLLLATENMTEIRFKDLLEIYVKINEEVKNNKELEEKVFDLLYKMENGDKEVTNKFRNIVDICIKGQVNIFNEIDIKYDIFDHESDYLLDNKLKEILNKLKITSKLLEDNDKRLVLDLTEYNLNFLVLTRGDKTSLYPLRDIAYTMDKIKQNSKNNYIVLGEDQKTYFQQIKKALELLGFENAPTPIHYSFVLLKDGKMSTREGKVVLLEDFIKLAVEKAKNEIEKRGNTSTKELTKSIAYGSLKYTILKASNEKNVIFDIDKAISFEGDTGAYLQYQYARICSMLRKFHKPIKKDVKLVLKENQEYDLIKELSLFPIVIEKTAKELSPHLICNYLQNLTKMFSKYYNDFKIIGDNKEVTESRVVLISCIKVVLFNGLNILGIEPLEKM